ncbi:hypothetical protein RJT34_06981 [Clitoria ternatea]|uniref:Uncharacterized protein n=1 Tax=Clitoria ternatea TaxID=43366 RepID=A0AAN9PUL5_CLITE
MNTTLVQGEKLATREENISPLRFMDLEANDNGEWLVMKHKPQNGPMKKNRKMLLHDKEVVSQDNANFIPRIDPRDSQALSHTFQVHCFHGSKFTAAIFPRSITLRMWLEGLVDEGEKDVAWLLCWFQKLVTNGSNELAKESQATYNQEAEVTEAPAHAALESSNLIVGADFTTSNEWTGRLLNNGKLVQQQPLLLSKQKQLLAIGRGKVTTPAQAQEVNYAIATLYYVRNGSNKEEILKPEVVDLIKRYAVAEEVSVSFSNLAKAFLDKHLSRNQ